MQDSNLIFLERLPVILLITDTDNMGMRTMQVTHKVLLLLCAASSQVITSSPRFPKLSKIPMLCHTTQLLSGWVSTKARNRRLYGNTVPQRLLLLLHRPRHRSP